MQFGYNFTRKWLNCTRLRLVKLPHHLLVKLYPNYTQKHVITYTYYTPYYTLHTEHAYCLSYPFLNNVVITTVIEMVEILDGRLGKRSVERVRYIINNLLHLVIVKYGVISLVLCISTRLRLVTILLLLVQYLIILHADLCNKSYNWGASERARRYLLMSTESRYITCF